MIIRPDTPVTRESVARSDGVFVAGTDQPYPPDRMPPEQQELLEIAERNTIRLITLINDILVSGYRIVGKG